MRYLILSILLVGCSNYFKFKYKDEVYYNSDFYGKLKCSVQNGFGDIFIHTYEINCLLNNGFRHYKTFYVNETELIK